jgi:hypothetical protein
MGATWIWDGYRVEVTMLIFVITMINDVLTLVYPANVYVFNLWIF